MREDVPAKAIKATKLGIFEEQGRCVEAFGPKLDLIRALESGRIVSRDIGGSDPERMAPPRYLFFTGSLLERLRWVQLHLLILGDGALSNSTLPWFTFYVNILFCNSNL